MHSTIFPTWHRVQGSMTEGFEGKIAHQQETLGYVTQHLLNNRGFSSTLVKDTTTWKIARRDETCVGSMRIWRSHDRHSQMEMRWNGRAPNSSSPWRLSD